MARFLLTVTLFSLAALVSAVPQSYATYAVPAPAYRNNLVPLKSVEQLPLPLSLNNYEFQIIPNNQYAVAEYDDPKASLSIFDIIPLPNPITAVVKIASKLLSVGKWLLLNSGFIIFGAALVFSLCAFSSYCSLVIEKPLVAKLKAIPYLDELEGLFKKAYLKYHK